MQATHRDHSRRTATLDPHDYTVAWIAPLEIEAQAALNLLDERHRGRFQVSRGDDYVFHAGNMRGHNVVIATLPAGQEYGTGSAAALASQVKKFFPKLWFGLLVGVAMGLPDLSRRPARDIRLGDVLVGLPDGESAGLVAYDLGKETEDGFELLKHGHALAVTEPIVRAAIGSIKLEAPNDAEVFLHYYEAIRDNEHATGTFADPGQDRDKLYLVQANGTEQVIERVRRPDARRTRVWYGPIGSGEKLIKNAQKRNELRDRYGVIGVEMEAAGTMNRIPVGVIRGVCDYGDKHKNKEWQPYAAAMAAAYGKAVLDEIPPNDSGRSDPPHQSCYHIQLAKNPRFTGRAAVLDILEEKLFGQEPCQRTALVGLGGVGKTQIALYFAYGVKEKRPEYSIFWVPIVSGSSAEQAYIEMAKKLGVQKKSDEEDIKELVCQYLSSDEAGRWLLVVDNADNQELVFGSTEGPGIEEFLPKSDYGLILLTTRSRQVAEEFAQADIIDVEQMGCEEATHLLEKSLTQKQMLQDEVLVIELLAYLTYLPLAITQAAAYFNQTKAPIHKYLSLLRGAERDATNVLGREFRDNTRYRESRNAVATTWLVSFDQIEKSNKTAVAVLSFMSCIEPRAIPQSMLPGSESEELEWAIGILCGYSFLVRRGDSDMFDMHSLVHMAMRGWTEKQGRRAQVVEDATSHLADNFPSHNAVNRDLWRSYMPHALRLLYGSEAYEAEECRYDLLGSAGRCLLTDRRFKEAVRCFEEMCGWEGEEEKTLDEKDHFRLSSEQVLAGAYLNDRRIKEAIEMLEHVVSVRRKTLDEKDHSRLSSEHELARAYLTDRRIKEAIKILEHVVSVRRKTLDEKDHFRLSSEQVLARAYLDDRRIKEAIKMLERVLSVQTKTLDEKDHFRLSSEHVLAIAYLKDGLAQEAINLLEHVVAIESQLYAQDDPDRQVSVELLAHAYGQLEAKSEMSEDDNEASG
ncbi:hypothetical protein BKA67DRAFT_525928 [Truncatella angustata]|uniref:NB-ARC domain-containing protein n=1 Tax=Truncatella angustata TaxID=152316 RepID=A0A9P8RHN1_9PEZI|nr:uncharacterized protein BKA67DRAFT_525928 [Truncatella angustata]KAH6646194.1 hypothetical protein BKA67DRAFT_525928 [Truncatella angustata]